MPIQYPAKPEHKVWIVESFIQVPFTVLTCKGLYLGRHGKNPRNLSYLHSPEKPTRLDSQKVPHFWKSPPSFLKSLPWLQKRLPSFQKSLTCFLKSVPGFRKRRHGTTNVQHTEVV